MASTGLAQLNLTWFDGAGKNGDETYNLSSASLNPNIQKQFAFATGDNTITKPTGATHLVIANITGTLHLYASGSPAITTGLILIPVPATTILINAAAGAIADLLWVV